jgi:hypothetical protein
MHCADGAVGGGFVIVIVSQSVESCRTRTLPTESLKWMDERMDGIFDGHQ